MHGSEEIIFQKDSECYVIIVISLSEHTVTAHMIFNEAQQKVISAIDGVWVIISGPGSGKTACMVERRLKMAELGIPNSDILNLTFTNAAASEAAKRVGIADPEKVFRTFHSFALELIRKERANLPFKLTESVIPVRGEEYQLLFDLVKQFPMIPSFRSLQSKLSEWKRANVEPEQAMHDSKGTEYYYALAYEEYEIKCRQQGWLDFDSLMRETVQLLEINQDVRTRYQKKYLTVDECQDTDITQFKLLKLLFAGNIMVVGDENQLIYEWRSAQPGNLSNFTDQYPGARILYLGQNYRSTTRLVEFYKEILPVDNGLASHMKTDNEHGVDPVLVSYPDSDTEVRRVLDMAAKDPEHSVIIARTNRKLFEVQRIATSKGIKYKNLGKKDFWEMSEVKALLTLARDGSPFQNSAQGLKEIIRDHNLYNRYRGSSDSMYSDPIENLNSVVQIASNKGLPMAQFLDYVRRLTYGRKSRKEKDLMLATVHQAKGREWDNVFVIGSEHGVMPHKDGELAEEKRIFFVACSRAAKNLHISWAGNRSMFLDGREFKNYEPEVNDAPISSNQKSI